VGYDKNFVNDNQCANPDYHSRPTPGETLWLKFVKATLRNLEFLKVAFTNFR